MCLPQFCAEEIIFLVYISDIYIYKLVYFDDTKLRQNVKEEKDVEHLQEELDKLFKWQESNHMLFNGSKFQLIRYGNDEDIKNNTLYFTDNTEHIMWCSLPGPFNMFKDYYSIDSMIESVPLHSVCPIIVHL